jgi:hypothetical protein
MVTIKDSTMFGREVPTIQVWEDLEDFGLIVNEDIFLGLSPPLTPDQTTCVAFVVDQEQDLNTGGFYNFGAQQNTHPHYNSTSTLLNDQHPQENKWFDEYVNFSEEFFGTSSRSLPTNTGAHFPSQSGYEAGGFYSNSFAGFNHQQQSVEHQMQDLSGGPSTSSGSAATQLSRLNIQEPSFGFAQTAYKLINLGFSIDPSLRPPIPESEYSASYSAPGSAYSSDEWSGASEQSAQEILEEIHRECAEIERKSVSPPLRQKTLVVGLK